MSWLVGQSSHMLLSLDSAFTPPRFWSLYIFLSVRRAACAMALCPAALEVEPDGGVAWLVAW